MYAFAPEKPPSLQDEIFAWPSSAFLCRHHPFAVSLPAAAENLPDLRK
jgi:hypothetical protein